MVFWGCKILILLISNIIYSNLITFAQILLQFCFKFRFKSNIICPNLINFAQISFCQMMQLHPQLLSGTGCKRYKRGHVRILSKLEAKFTRLFAELSRLGGSEVTFAVFEPSCRLSVTYICHCMVSLKLCHQMRHMASLWWYQNCIIEIRHQNNATNIFCIMRYFYLSNFKITTPLLLLK